MKKPRCISNAAGLYCGAGDRIRTGDIYLGKVVLYQLSYSRAGAGVIRKGGDVPALAENKLFALTYFCRGLPPNYHRRWRA